ncbi:cobalamin-binding protein [Castellaniella sp.]|uniref:cobalamin-binding protein n=1 Tax=Castellaniella sp. TaxID=1955812 RepID=UPI002B0030C2|nr:cobalamin-binding protein [Castellaniella sp.]
MRTDTRAAAEHFASAAHDLGAGPAAHGAHAAGGQSALAATGGPDLGKPRLTPSSRIITLAPSATELVYAAGAGADIVGTVLHSDYPPAARDIPRIGDGVQASEEAILALRPTLVVAWYPTDASRALASRLQALGTPLIYADPKTLDDIPALVRELGQRLGTQVRADATASALQQRIDRLPLASQPTQTVFIEISTDPLFTLGRDPLINDLLSRCGGRNLYADSRVAAPQVSVESVLHLNPHVLIMSPYGRETLTARTRWWAEHGLAAARQGRIYAIDPDWLHRPGPRLIDAAEAICRDLAQARAHSRMPSTP